jgi:hypothetical protein
MSVDCRAVRDGDLIEDYLLGRLTESDRDAFEAHFFECEDCYARLEAARLLRRELRASGAKVVPLRRFARTRTWLATAAGLGAVAVGVSFLTFRREGLAPAPATAPAPEILPSPLPAASPPPQLPPATVAPAAPRMVAPATPPPRPSPAPLATPRPQLEPGRVASSSLRDLGRFDPPPYVPGPPAGEPSAADRVFANAMTHYAKRDCRSALPDLRRAVALDPTRAEFAFYLGICSLLSDDVDAGITSLEKALAVDPRRDAAAFYLAKGLLLRGDRAAAQARLRDLAVRPGPFQGQSRTLLVQLDAVH